MTSLTANTLAARRMCPGERSEPEGHRPIRARRGRKAWGWGPTPLSKVGRSAGGWTLAASLTVAAATVSAQEPAASKPVVTIQNFATDRTGWMPPPQIGATLADLLTDRLIAAGTLRVVDGARVAPAEIDYVITGAVTRLSIEKRSTTGGGLLPIPIVGGLLRKHTTTTVIGLAIRVTDARTGEVIATATAESGASDQTAAVGGIALVGHAPVIAGKGSSATGFQDRLIDAAVQDVVTAAAAKIVASTRNLRGR